MTKRKLSWMTIAKKVLDKSAVQNISDGGGGQSALVMPCRGVGFSLWGSKAAAETWKGRLDRWGCCGGGHPWTHRIIDLSVVASFNN